MNVNVEGIGLLGNSAITESVNAPKATRTNSQVFDDMLAAATGIYSQTNTNLNSLQDMQLKVATGESDDFVGLNLMQSKANSSMQFFVQATNKAIEAYREIMRIQI